MIDGVAIPIIQDDRIVEFSRGQCYKPAARSDSECRATASFVRLGDAKCRRDQESGVEGRDLNKQSLRCQNETRFADLRVFDNQGER